MPPREATGGSPGSAPGVVFTPPELARELVEDLAAHAPCGSAVLDPSCGEGALLEAAARSGHFGPLYGLELRPELAERARRGSADVRCSDALEPGCGWPRGTWVAANPPWVSFSGRQAPPRAGAAPARPAGATRGAAERGWPYLHGAFVERIAEHVAREGTGAALLLPAALAELDGYAPLRGRIAPRVEVRVVRELGERAFPGVLEPAIEVLLLPRAGELDEPGGVWSAGPRASAFERAFAGFPRLPAKTFADPGVHTGNCAAELVLQGSGADREHPPVAQGRDLRPYHLGPAGARLRTDLEPGGGRRFRIAPRSHYESFPILLRQTANRPIAALHEPAGYFRNSLLACRRVEGLDPAFVVAVLNATPARAWHRSRFADARQRTFPQVKVKHLATQPFPIAHRDRDRELHDELARRVRALDPSARGFEDEVARIDRRVTAAFGAMAGWPEG